MGNGCLAGIPAPLELLVGAFFLEVELFPRLEQLIVRVGLSLVPMLWHPLALLRVRPPVLRGHLKLGRVGRTNAENDLCHCIHSFSSNGSVEIVCTLTPCD